MIDPRENRRRMILKAREAGKARAAGPGNAGKARVASQAAAQPLLRKADALLAERRFADALECYGEVLHLDPRNARTHTRMGIAALYLDDLDEAHHHFHRALDLDRDAVEAMNGLAYVALRRDDAVEATTLLCDALRVRPQDRFAKRNFQELKTAESIEVLIARLHPGDFVALPARELNPELARRLRRISVAVIVLGGLLLLLLVIGGDWRRFLMPRSYHGSGGTSAQTPYYYPSAIPLQTELGRSLKRALDGGSADGSLALSDEEISSTLTRMRQLLDSRRHNETRYLMNRILASDAGEVPRSMAREIGRFLRPPESGELAFNPDLAEILRTPGLFRDVSVQWLTRVVVQTNGVFLQLAPSRYHGGEATNAAVVAVAANLPVLASGSSVEVLGDVLGVDDSGARRILFLKLRDLKRLH